MEILLSRAERPLKYTYYRPVEYSMRQRQRIEMIRRKTDENRPNKTASQILDSPVDALQLMFSGTRKKYTEVKIEDQYKRDRFIGGFVYIDAMSVFVHEDDVRRIERRANIIGPGSVIHKGAHIEWTAKVGPNCELESGVHLAHGVQLGHNVVMRKGAVAYEDAQVGAYSHIGQFDVLGEGSVTGAYNVNGRNVITGHDAKTGVQNRYGAGTVLGPNYWADDSVVIGLDGDIEQDVIIGEMTRAGNNLKVEEGTLIGAESRCGNYVWISDHLMMPSPSHIPAFEYVSKSNMHSFMPAELKNK